MPTTHNGMTIPEYTDAADAPGAFTAFADSGPVPRFANAADRDAGIVNPVPGSVCYRADVHHVEVYDGSSWVSVGLPLEGGSMTGPLNMAGKALTGVPNPSGNNDAVNKGWAEAAFATAGHGHAYSPSNHTHQYLPLTGGTINGGLTITSGVRIGGGWAPGIASPGSGTAGSGWRTVPGQPCSMCWVATCISPGRTTAPTHA